MDESESLVELQETVEQEGFSYDRPFSLADKKALLDVIQEDAPELLQPTAIRRINRELWERMMVKFNESTKRDWNIRTLKSCLQAIMRKSMQQKGFGSQSMIQRQIQRFSTSEKQLMISLAKQHLVVFSKQKDGDTIINKRKAWTSMMISFNRSACIEGQRTAREIKTCVVNMLNRTRTEDVLELKAMIKELQDNESALVDGQPSISIQRSSSAEDQHRFDLTLSPERSSNNNGEVSMVYSQGSQFMLTPPSMIQTSHPQGPILLAPVYSTMPHMSAPGQSSHLVSPIGSLGHPMLPASSVLSNAEEPQSVTNGGQDASTLRDEQEASGRDDLHETQESPEQVYEIKDEVMTDDETEVMTDNHQQNADTEETTGDESNTQLSKVIRDVSSLAKEPPVTASPAGKATPRHPQIRVHGGQTIDVVTPRSPARTPPRRAASSPRIQQPATFSSINSFHGYGNLRKSPEHLQSRRVLSAARRSRKPMFNNVRRIQNRPVGIMGPKRAMEHQRSEQPLQLNSRNQQASSSVLQHGLPNGPNRKESLGRMKRRLLQEEHDLRIALMREEHAWHLEEHKWKREEHELRMSMIRINSKI